MQMVAESYNSYPFRSSQLNSLTIYTTQGNTITKVRVKVAQ